MSETAVEIAARLWHGPDPVSHCKREVIAYLRKAERAAHLAQQILGRAEENIFADLDRLWLRETQAEILLALAREAFLDTGRAIDDALYFTREARLENWNRHVEERNLDRVERGTAGG